MRKVGALGTVASLFAAGLSIAVATPASANGCSNTLFGGDNPDGSAGDPFLISTDTHLQNLKENDSCWASQYNFRQTTDISMGSPWTDHAIGTSSDTFKGAYNGDGNEISGLTINFGTDSTDEGDYAGLFGALDGTVSNLGFTGPVTGIESVGGLVGAAFGTVENSYATGDVSGTTMVGGLVGEAFDGTVQNSYATGDVSGTEQVGGLVGNPASSIVSDSYALGTVSGTQEVGGLVGLATGFTTIRRSYATGDVPTSGSDIGRLVGSLFTNVDGTGSFWNTDSAGTNVGVNQDPDATFEATGATTEEMRTLSTFEDAGWDIADSWSSSNTWGICEGSGYPYLTWQYTSNSEACGGGGSTPATSSGEATYTFTFLTSSGGVCFVDDNVAAGAYTLPTSQVACTPEGTELVGWSVPGQAGAFSDGGIVTASGDQTFTAVAKDPTMQVTFDPNVGADTACLLEGSDVEPEQRAVEVTLPRGGVIGEVAICAPAGHTLAGWTDRPTTDGPYAPVDGASLLTTGMEMPVTWHHDPNPVNSIRLYAVWSPGS